MPWFVLAFSLAGLFALAVGITAVIRGRKDSATTARGMTLQGNQRGERVGTESGIVNKFREPNKPSATDQRGATPKKTDETVMASVTRAQEASSDYDEGYIDNYWISVEETKRAITAKLKIKYQKTNKAITERVFDVSSFSRGERGYHLHGYCYRRKRNITLSSLGVLEAIDVESGELVSDVPGFLEEKYRGTSACLQDALFDDYGWALYVLIYLAATSGSVVKKERGVISQFIKSIPKFSSLSDAWIDETLKDLYRPGKMGIRNRVKAAASKGANFSLLDDAVMKLETMQKKENREFWTFKRYIEKQPK